MTRFRLLTNLRTDTARALALACGELGGELRFLDEPGNAREGGVPSIALLFAYGFPRATEEALDSLRAIGIPTGVWQLDDPHFLHAPELRDVTIRLARKADVYFSHTRQLDDEYAALGVEVLHLPSGARVLPECRGLVGAPLRAEHCARDVAFVGTLSPARVLFLEAVARLLPGRVRIDTFSGLTLADAFEVYRTSRVNLSFGSATVGAAGLTERTFEVPLVGGFLLQDERPTLAEHFALDTEAVTFGDAREGAGLIARFLEDDAARLSVAARAQARVLREHTLAHRLAWAVDRLLARETAHA